MASANLFMVATLIYYTILYYLYTIIHTTVIVNFQVLISMKIVLTVAKGLDESQPCFLGPIIEEIPGRTDAINLIHILTNHGILICFNFFFHLYLFSIDSSNLGHNFFKKI